ncbi:AraC-like DNA-binding protein [Paraburkholderia sp. CI3]
MSPGCERSVPLQALGDKASLVISQKLADWHNLAVDIVVVNTDRRCKFLVRSSALNANMDTSKLRRFNVETGETEAFQSQRRTLCSPGAWNGIVFERWQHAGKAEALDETILHDHVIALNLGQAADYEIAWEGNPMLRRRCNGGQFALFPAQLPYRAVRYSEWDGIIVGINRTLFDAAILGSTSLDRLQLRPCIAATDGLIHHLVLALLQDAVADCPQGPAYGENLILTLAAQLCRGFGQVDIEPTAPALGITQLRSVQDYVESNLERAIHLQELAEITGMSLYCFARAFKAATTFSPHKYITQRRLTTAKRLLATSKLSLVEISLRCGFSSQSHFGNSFAQEVKLTPGQYRKLAKNG